MAQKNHGLTDSDRSDPLSRPVKRDSGKVGLSLLTLNVHP